MNRRVKLIKYTLQNMNMGGTAKSWFFSCFGPTCEILAKRAIEELSFGIDFNMVRIRGYNRANFKTIKGGLLNRSTVEIPAIERT